MSKTRNSRKTIAVLILSSAVVVILVGWIGESITSTELLTDYRIAARRWMASFLPMGFVAGFISFLLLELPAIALMSATAFLVAMTNWKYSRLVGVSLAVSYAVVRISGYLIVTAIIGGPIYWKGFLSGIVGVAGLGMLIGLVAWRIGHQIKLNRLEKMGAQLQVPQTGDTSHEKTEKPQDEKTDEHKRK